MKFKMYHVILIVIILVVIGGLIYLRCLKKLEKPVVLYESEESTEEEKNDTEEEKNNTEENEKKEENIDIPVYPGIPTIDGETVKNGEIIKPSKIIKETFANYVDLEYFASGFQEGVNEDAYRFYASQSFIGDSVWHGLYSEYVASSTLKSSEDKYNVMNLDDLLTSSCWSEGKKGDGVGETIEIETFDTSEKVEWSNDENEINRDCTKIEDVEEYLKTHAIYDKPEGRFVTEEDMKSFRNEIYKVAIINGYANDDVLWKKNNRVKKLKLTIDDKIECYLELEDTKDLQLFDINYYNDSITKKIKMKFEIMEVYPGEKYDDTCITSLYLVGGSNVKWGGR